MHITTETQEAVFKIGVVSKITNIPVDTLRIWERRYSVVTPIRSKKADRLYQTKDLNRLSLLKMLVDRGHSIGTIARLTNSELNDILKSHEQNILRKKNDNLPSTFSAVAIGEVISLQLKYSQSNNSHVAFTGIYKNENDFLENNKEKSIDILILEYPTIHEDHIDKIEALFKKSGAQELILIYGFTNSAAKANLNKNNYTYIQAPITADILQTAITNLIKEKDFKNDNHPEIDISTRAPSRKYTNSQLIKLSSASSTIKCECPQHLSSIILKLIQFEKYSTECVNRYNKDSKLHAILGNMTGHARSIMEEALTKITKAESNSK
jgi:MerR family transcriptional regulator, light-induced transcriptional regulator